MVDETLTEDKWTNSYLIASDSGLENIKLSWCMVPMNNASNANTWRLAELRHRKQ
jgi:hypothetical protein